MLIVPWLVVHDAVSHANASSSLSNILIFFLPENFRAFAGGFLNACKSILSEDEIAHLVLGTNYMVFIMGLRFLTDYLNKDIYYKTNK